MSLVVEDDTPTTLADLRAISDRIDERLEREAVDLRELLETEQLLINEAQKLLDHFSERGKRIRRALAAIEGTTAAPPKAPAKASKTHRWNVSDEVVEKVYAAISASIEANGGKPTTLTEARERAGGGHETYRQAVDKLRADERVRVAGKTRGGGTLLALMPEVTADAA